MSTAINRLIAKLAGAKACALFGILAALILSLVPILNLAPVDKAQAAIPIPSNYQLILQGTGLKVYQKKGGVSDYVSIVDLRYGTLRNFTGSVSGESIYPRTLTTHWNNAVAQNTSTRKAKVVINGTFFSVKPQNPPTPEPLTFGLKADWWRMSYGYNPYEFGVGKTLTFAFDSSFGISSIQLYSRATFDGGIPNVVGGLDTTCCKGPSTYNKRTFVGVRDDDGNGHSETVIFFSSASATQYGAVNVLSSFGAGSKMMLDGGSSTALMINGVTKIAPSYSLPQVFILCEGK